MASDLEKDEAGRPFLGHSEPNEDDIIVKMQKQQRHNWRNTILSLGIGVLLSSVLWLTAWSIYLDSKPSITTTQRLSAASPPKTNCGHSPAEAKANGCHFQLWSYSWVPPQCFDKELHDDFLALRDKEDWHYYSDTQTPWVQVPLDSVLAGDRWDLHSTWGQHFWHCAFYQRKFFRVVEEHDGERTPMLKMTNRDLDAEHSEHCQKWLANPTLYPWDEVRINLTVGFHECS